eukprot:2543630-Amphidinium_carterae.1
MDALGLTSNNTKTPPSWDPAKSEQYSFDHWRKDTLLWASATELKEEQRALAVVLRLGGMARHLAREVDTSILVNGDFVEGKHLSGLEILLKGLEKRFAPLQVEEGTKSIAALFTFRRQGHETIDQALARWDVLRQRAKEQGQCELSSAGYAWQLLQGLQVPPVMWSQLLARFDGVLPTTESSLRELTTLVRRQGHLSERGGLVDLARNPSQVHQSMGRQQTTQNQGVRHFLALQDEGSGSMDG